MRIDPDTCRDPDMLAAEVRRLEAVIAAGEAALTDAERPFAEHRSYSKNDGKRPIADMSGENTQDQEHRMSDSTTPQDGKAMPPASAGSHGKPVAWAVCTPENWGQETPCFFCEQQARDHASTIAGMKNIVKLYRSPTLTDEEREAIEYVLDGLLPDGDREGDMATGALRGLLARTK
jgi:hypothetical protein